MAADRFVYWKERKPSREEVELVLTNFLGGIGKVEWKTGRFFMDIPGKSKDAMNGIEFVESVPEEVMRPNRWIEIYLTDDYIDIITRSQDHFTNSLADGLANLFATYWDGIEGKP